MGGNLTVITSSLENVFVTNMSSAQNHEPAWIGIHDLDNDGTFTYSNGKNFIEGVSFDNWHGTEPQAPLSSAQCVVLQPSSKWKDNTCLSARAFVCEESPAQPTITPTQLPSESPTANPTLAPTQMPTGSPTVQPTLRPTQMPTESPTAQPTITPTQLPTESPTAKPTLEPTLLPTDSPTAKPTLASTQMPTESPTAQPTLRPTQMPTESPTAQPTMAPTQLPTDSPSAKPTLAPTQMPTESPTVQPTLTPTQLLTANSTSLSTATPTFIPTAGPTLMPTEGPTATPTLTPTANPTSLPTATPTFITTADPTLMPTEGPTATPTLTPTANSTSLSTATPTLIPTTDTTLMPTERPTATPILTPTENCTSLSTATPTFIPTAAPTLMPTQGPTATPTLTPTANSTSLSTATPTYIPTAAPTLMPTQGPTATPTSTPTANFTSLSTATPTYIPTAAPTLMPTEGPTATPTLTPTANSTSLSSATPTFMLTAGPTMVPTEGPTDTPTLTPTDAPTAQPSTAPSAVPTIQPTTPPTDAPKATQTLMPTEEPPATPTLMPTDAPTGQPSTAPTAVPTIQPTTPPTDALKEPTNVSVTLTPTLTDSDSDISPVVQLSAPSQNSYCVNLTLDASGSYGSAGGFLSFAWSVSSQQNVSNALQDYLVYHSTNNPSGSTLTIPSSLLSPFRTYRFNVTVTNLLGRSSSGSASVLISGAAIPELRISGDSELVMVAGDPLSVFANAAAAECGINSTSDAGLSYNWTLFDESGVAQPSLQSYSVDSRYFKLLEYSLKAGTSYWLAVQVMDSYSQANTAEVKIIVARSALTVRIDGGDRSVSQASSLYLDASSSEDPDEGDGHIQGVKFHWSCSHTTSWGGLPVCNNLSLPETGSVLLPAHSLLANTTYQFVVNVSSEVEGIALRWATASVAITVLAASVPSVQILQAETTKVAPSGKLVLEGLVSISENLLATSTWLSPSFTDLSTIASTDTQATLAPFSSIMHYLVLPASTLVAGETLSFTLSAAYDGKPYFGTAEVLIEVNSPPENGIFLVSPDIGHVLVDEFTLQTMGWDDETTDFPLTYSFFHRIGESEAVLLSTVDMGNYLEGVLLPQGTGDDFTLTCGVYVSDKFDATAEESSMVSVRPFQSTVNELAAASSSLLSKALETASGASVVLQMTTAVASSLQSSGNCSDPIHAEAVCMNLTEELLVANNKLWEMMDITSQSLSQLASSLDALVSSGGSLSVKGGEVAVSQISLITSAMVDEGILDSISVISVLDQLIGTEVVTDLDIANQLIGSVDDLGLALVGDLVAGESPAVASSETLKVLAAKYSGSSTISVSLPGNQGRSTPSFQLEDALYEDTSLAPAVALLLSEFLVDPFLNLGNSSNSSVSSFVGVLISTGSTQQSRELNEDTQNNVTVHVTHVYSEPVEFENTTHEFYEVECDADTPGMKTVYCGSGESMRTEQVECTGRASLYQVDCSIGGTEPICVGWSGLKWDSSVCTRTAFNSTHAVCSCHVEGDASAMRIFSTQLGNIGTEMKLNFAESPQLVAYITKDFTVFISVGLIIFFIPLMTYLSAIVHVISGRINKNALLIHHHKHNNVNEDVDTPQLHSPRNRVSNLIQHTIQDIHNLYEEVIPDQLKKGRRWMELRRRMKHEHLYMKIITVPTGNWTRPRKLIFVTSVLLTMMFWDATIFGAVFPASGSCASYTTQISCEMEKNPYDTTQPLCHWNQDDSEMSCQEFFPDDTLELTIYIAVISLLFSIPIEMIILQILEKAIFPPVKVKDYNGGIDNSTSLMDDSIQRLDDSAAPSDASVKGRRASLVEFFQNAQSPFEAKGGFADDSVSPKKTPGGRRSSTVAFFQGIQSSIATSNLEGNLPSYSNSSFTFQESAEIQPQVADKMMTQIESGNSIYSTSSPRGEIPWLMESHKAQLKPIKTLGNSDLVSDCAKEGNQNDDLVAGTVFDKMDNSSEDEGSSKEVVEGITPLMSNEMQANLDLGELEISEPPKGVLDGILLVENQHVPDITDVPQLKHSHRAQLKLESKDPGDIPDGIDATAKCMDSDDLDSVFKLPIPKRQSARPKEKVFADGIEATANCTDSVDLESALKLPVAKRKPARPKGKIYEGHTNGIEATADCTDNGDLESALKLCVAKRQPARPKGKVFGDGIDATAKCMDSDDSESVFQPPIPKRQSARPKEKVFAGGIEAPSDCTDSGDLESSLKPPVAKRQPARPKGKIFGDDAKALGDCNESEIESKFKLPPTTSVAARANEKVLGKVDTIPEQIEKETLVNKDQGPIQLEDSKDDTAPSVEFRETETSDCQSDGTYEVEKQVQNYTATKRFSFVGSTIKNKRRRKSISIPEHEKERIINHEWDRFCNEMDERLNHRRPCARRMYRVWQFLLTCNNTAQRKQKEKISIRIHVDRALKLRASMNGKPVPEQNILLLKAAQRDYMNFSEKRILGNLDDIDVNSHSNHPVPRWAPILGWCTLYLYCAFCIFYICLFGYRHGVAVCRLWLQTFLMGLAEELVLLVPIKIWVFFFVLPSIISKRMEIKRIQSLPTYAASCQVAREMPFLVSSKIILEGYLPNDKKMKKYFKLKQRNWLKLVVSSILVIVLVLPYKLQEIIIESLLAVACNYLLLGLVRLYEHDRTNAFGMGITCLLVGFLWVFRRNLKQGFKCIHIRLKKTQNSTLSKSDEVV